MQFYQLMMVVHFVCPPMTGQQTHQGIIGFLDVGLAADQPQARGDTQVVCVYDQNGFAQGAEIQDRSGGLAPNAFQFLQPDDRRVSWHFSQKIKRQATLACGHELQGRLQPGRLPFGYLDRTDHFVDFSDRSVAQILPTAEVIAQPHVASKGHLAMGQTANHRHHQLRHRVEQQVLWWWAIVVTQMLIHQQKTSHTLVRKQGQLHVADLSTCARTNTEHILCDQSARTQPVQQYRVITPCSASQRLRYRR